MIEFILNDKLVIAVSPPTTVLLDFLRREQKLIGTKEGCREGDCGACSVLIGELKGNEVKYKNVNSCLLPIGALQGKHVVTIEGLNSSSLSVIQNSFVREGGTQCGFCTPGFIVSLSGYFLNAETFSYDDAINYLSGNICRCTGYAGIKRAVDECAAIFENTAEEKKNRIANLTAHGFIPGYFAGIAGLLKKIKTAEAPMAKGAPLVSGGTDLYVQKWEELVNSRARFIGEKELNNKILPVKGRVYIGASATIEEIKNSKILNKYFPGWEGYLNLFGSLPIRNRATAGGNIVNASPIGDFTSILLALNAEVHLKGGGRKRSQLLRDFYTGYKKLNMKKNEIVEAFSFPVPSKRLLFNYEKVSKRTYLDIASVNTSMSIELKNDSVYNINVSAGGVAPIPLYLGGMCMFLKGKELNAKNIKDGVAVALAEINPISDARGSAQYKRVLLRQLLYAHFIRMFNDKIEPEGLL